MAFRLALVSLVLLAALASGIPAAAENALAVGTLGPAATPRGRSAHCGTRRALRQVAPEPATALPAPKRRRKGMKAAVAVPPVAPTGAPLAAAAVPPVAPAGIPLAAAAVPPVAPAGVPAAVLPAAAAAAAPADAAAAAAPATAAVQTAASAMAAQDSFQTLLSPSAVARVPATAAADVSGVASISADGADSTPIWGTSITDYAWQVSPAVPSAAAQPVTASGEKVALQLAPGTWTVQLTVTDSAGGQGSDNVTVVVTTIDGTAPPPALPPAGGAAAPLPAVPVQPAAPSPSPSPSPSLLPLLPPTLPSPQPAAAAASAAVAPLPSTAPAVAPVVVPPPATTPPPSTPPGGGQDISPAGGGDAPPKPSPPPGASPSPPASPPPAGGGASKPAGAKFGPMPWVPDIFEYCEQDGKGNVPTPDCFKYWCDLAENSSNADCDKLWEFCDGNGGKNWDLPECSAPCELEANLDDPRCLGEGDEKVN
ncbi:hypothetical protein Rsub_09609 [Raphidocelis subcapitata]|uniref:PKD domain-containing protein n=1 Tax=Raphidocelis subcapitata TaxID=307507 RepID=A0A2V0PFS9_9CHLO|nr:hypothetical protein Rsub_09609 [Raphidocelis subcapitata]|eukprot:GBF96753.1 hypothetical protein Rsub_09609 [Raphidocelis subcapitata]